MTSPPSRLRSRDWSGDAALVGGRSPRDATLRDSEVFRLGDGANDNLASSWTRLRSRIDLAESDVTTIIGIDAATGSKKRDRLGLGKRHRQPEPRVRSASSRRHASWARVTSAS